MFQQERVCQVNLVPEQETGIIERGCNNPTKLVNFESTDVATVSLPLLELSIPSPSIGGNKKEGRSLGTQLERDLEGPPPSACKDTA